MATEDEDRREAERQSWQYKAVAATRGNQTFFGTVVLAVIGRNAKRPPWIESSFTITSEGVVLADFVDHTYWEHKNQPLFTATDLRDNFRALADDLKLDDDDRKAMFDEVRKFIKHDFRAEHDELRLHA